MHCRFVVYNVPWEKREELLSHECVGLKERILSCERSQPVNTPEPIENNVVKEVFDEVGTNPVTMSINSDILLEDGYWLA